MGLLFNVAVAVFSSVGAFLFGYATGIISSILTMDHYIAHFGNDPNIKGAVVSTFNGGCFFGAAGAGWANDKWGRKRCIQIGCLFSLWGVAMQAGADNVATLLIGRIVGGFAIGILSMTVPLYNTEIAPPKIRGFLVGLTQQMIGIGFIVANWVGYGSQFINSDISWRMPLGLQMVPAGLLLMGTQLLPFSPRWLLEVGRDEEAREVVYKLHGNDRLSADREFKHMYDTIKAELSVRSRRLSDLWATRAMLRRTLVAIGVQAFTQFTGINVINYYGPQVYTSLGVTGERALLVQGIYGAVGPIANLFFIVFILDRVGRKKPLMFGASSFVVTFSILAAILATNPGWDRDDFYDEYLFLFELWSRQLGVSIRGLSYEHSFNWNECCYLCKLGFQYDDGTGKALEDMNQPCFRTRYSNSFLLVPTGKMLKAETIQIRDAEMTSSKAAKAEFAKEYDQAFRLYIKAAESFLHLSRSSAQSDQIKQQWKASASKALERAERIKKFVEKCSKIPLTSSQQSAASLRLTPVAINHFSPQEQSYVLKKGENVNGLSFLLWDDHVQTSSISPYTDPDGQPKLSPDQQKNSCSWKRPNQRPGQSMEILRRRIMPEDILQHIVTDCSVCASISVCLEHSRRFGSTLAVSSIDSSRNKLASKYTASQLDGRYDIRVLFNGAWRRVVIDDKLPFNPTDGTLMCMSILPPHPTSKESKFYEEISWPSLLEKAYMKLMGGYDFPGSNSSTDLHAFIGWIPEYIDIKGSNFEREKTWERIENGFSSGQCVVTLGTGPRFDNRWRDVHLLPSHSYAVIDVHETEEGRMFTVLDSWVRSNGEERETSRTLQISWPEVMNSFDGVYLSWNPEMWQHSLTFHGMWKRSGEDDLNGSRQVHLEFNTSSFFDQEIWVLLMRHVPDTHRISDFIALKVEIEDDLMPLSRVVENQHILSSKGTYTNSTHILARIRIPISQRSGTLSILASYDGDARELGFTLSAFAKSSMNITWVENTPTPPYTYKVEGCLTSKNAGGNCTYPTFMVNPQYHLVIHPQQARVEGRVNGKTRVTLTLQANKDVPVNVAMVRTQGKRVAELSEKELVATSGAYSYGLVTVTKELSIGEYTVVASAFEPHHMGSFSLKVDSSYPFDLKPIPQEGAGMYCKVVRGSWEGETAAGGPSFDHYERNPMFEVDIPSSTQLKIRLQLLQPSTSIALNVTVYPQYVKPSLNQQRHVLTSGAYDDTIAGVATPQISVAAGKYYAVPSTYNPGTEVGFKLIVYSSIAGVMVTQIV
ncbi:hypothetical protein BYT27DRAFT_7242680 [Phlegmacium glaucopus]|nr:hypothetical protein BYT27DRAFT_7242680 [Phlegmacium glaucopus]